MNIGVTRKTIHDHAAAATVEMMISNIPIPRRVQAMLKVKI